jgi:glycosyltransferase involved in cell wall biosynthesis
MPLVSIIIPCYNAEKYVAEAIQSALDQTYPECEVIVIDDGSSDGSLEVIKGFGEKIRWESGPNRGGCAARNRGAALAKGEYFQFLDADDVLDAAKVGHQANALSGLPRAASTCRLIVSRDPKRETRQLPAISSQQIPGKVFLVRWVLGEITPLFNPQGDPGITYGNSTSWLVSREIFAESGGWNESLTVCQDSELFAKVASICQSIDVNAEAFGFYRIGVANCVSAGRSRTKAESFLAYCQTTERLLRETQNSKLNEAISNLYTSFIQRFYPMHKDLVDWAFKAIAATGRPACSGIKAPRLRQLSRIVGVRMALRIQQLVRRSS